MQTHELSPPTPGVFAVRPLEAMAATKINKALGQESFRKIREARRTLDSVDVPLRARKFDEVQVRGHVVPVCVSFEL